MACRGGSGGRLAIHRRGSSVDFRVRFILPSDLRHDIKSLDVRSLLDFLDVADLYPGLLERSDPELTVFDYYAPKHLISYSLRNNIPLPSDAAEFLRDYATTYTPLQHPDDGV
jgi:hypothetical protein